MSKLNEALQGEKEYRTAVESAAEYIENFDILETITNVGNDEVFTPRKVAEAMLDCLPKEVWHNPDYKWLNPASKNGVFEREIALRLDKGLAEIIPDKETRRKHILQKMVFSLGETYFTSHVARRTLYYCSDANRKCDGIKASDGHYVNGFAIGNGTWFDTSEGNVLNPCTDHDFRDKKGRPKPPELTFDSADELKDNQELKEQLDQYSCVHCGIKASSAYNVANQLEKYAYEFIHVPADKLLEHLQDRFFNGDRNMKFDVIIGNPPYQLNDGGYGASAIPIYQLFVEKAKALFPEYISLIIPARWFGGGRDLDEFRSEMIADKRIRILHDYLNAGDCFPNSEIKGGICFFLWDREREGMCTITTHIGNRKILQEARFLREDNSDVFIRSSEGVSIYHKVRSFNEKTFDVLVSAQRPFGLRTYEHGTKTAFKNSVKLYERGGTGYINRNDITKNVEWIDSPKVYISAAYNAGDNYPHQIIGKPIIGNAGSACTETYVVIGPFSSETEVKNVVSYIKTKFFRFLVLLKKSSQHAASTVYSFVPQQDFSKPWTDEELYKKYNITEAEIAFIDSMVRPMDLDGGDD